MNEAPAQAPGPFCPEPLPEATEDADYSQEEEEDDEFVYSQLDTIAEEEEDEEDAEDAAARARRAAQKSGRLAPQKVAANGAAAAAAAAAGNQRGNQHQNHRQQQAVKQDNKSRAPTTVRPQAANCATLSQRRAADNGGDIGATDTKCDTATGLQHQEQLASKRMQQQQQQQQQLPSTNRLISEHQARQQQTLFKALAERQKLMDELAEDDGELRRRFDLMSSASAVASLKRTSTRARRPQHQQHHQQDGGVPLSAVDLSSMSDGMLDELLGHIASASSSSLSSQCGESLDSSELGGSASSSPGATSSDSSASSSSSSSEPRRRRKRRRRRPEPPGLEPQREFGSPNVVGVHEEPVASISVARRSGSACREAHRRDDHHHQNGNDDDHDQHHRLELRGARHQQEAPLSPAGEAPREPQSAEANQRRPTKLEQYFTSGLVEPHHFGSEEEEEEAEADDEVEVGAESVEEVLARMLAALQEIGPDEQERLNELLERGFAHLEQLLQCSLAPSASEDQQQQHQSQAQQQQGQQAGPGKAKLQPNSASSSPSTLLLSKDSDYGSDTQSADCLSGQPAPVAAAAGSSPAPSSLNTNSSKQSAPKRPELSPLAIELSFKLAESLHRLAQQQQQQQQTSLAAAAPATAAPEPSPAPARQQPRMKSIVMINSSPLPSSSSCSSPASPAPPGRGNPTPAGAEEPPPRSIFKTRVNIGGGGGGGGGASSRVVVVAESPGAPVEPVASHKHQDLAGEHQPERSKVQQAFERRRSLRNSSMRRRLSAGQQQQLQQPRPGSPLPLSCLQHQEQAAEPIEGAEAAGKLQRALVLAQKYNYSPAKLAASKLGAKLSISPNCDAEPSEAQRSHFNGNSQATLSPLAKTEEPQAEIRVSGRMELDISYFAKTGSLTVHVLQCSQLAAVSKRRTTSNPYVKLYLLPDRSKSGKRKSSIQRSQLEPKFDEKFTFGPLQLAEFSQKILWLSVWHKDRLGRNEFLGELLLPLAQVRQQLISSDLCQSTGAKWYQLQERMLQQQESGSQLEKRKKKQQQLEHKLGELQLKAARLAAVAPTAAHHQASERQQSQPEPLEGMRVRLGPTLLGPHPNQPPQPNATTITGQLFVALKFVVGQPFKTGSSRSLKQAQGELHVMIKEAHSIGGFVDRLPPPAGALPNPFCKCYLLNSDGRRLAKQKTPHLKRTVNPRWDHRCTFAQLRLGALASQAIEIHMFNRDSILVSNEHLGGVRLCRAQAQGQSQQTSATTTTTTNINNDDATSIASSERSSSVDGSLRPGLGSFKRQDSSSIGHNSGSLDEPDGALCSERESRLWTQMMARPNIWVYGELRLRQLPPLIPLGEGAAAVAAAPTGSQQ